MFKSVHRWLHMPAVARGSISQCRQWVTPVRQTELHFKTRKLFWLLFAVCDKTPALLANLIIQLTAVGWIGATHH